MSPNQVFEVKVLNVAYRRVQVLQDVSFAMGVEPLGLVGSNGMGKTTLVNAIAGMVLSQSGPISVEGAILPINSHTRCPEQVSDMCLRDDGFFRL